jgi:predicted transcriptional regulator
VAIRHPGAIYSKATPGALSAVPRVRHALPAWLRQHLRLTQQELADLVEASRPVVSTILNEHQDEGGLGYNRECIVRRIEDIEKLVES